MEQIRQFVNNTVKVHNYMPDLFYEEKVNYWFYFVMSAVSICASCHVNCKPIIKVTLCKHES